MMNQRETEPRSPSGRWKSLGQLCELWGLSRARTRLVVNSLVRSGRMEVRDLPPPEAPRHVYRVVEKQV